MMDPGQPHHTPTDGVSEGETLNNARRQLALLQRRIEVEEALERVRTKAMVMHHSDDLAKVATTVFDQLNTLAIDMLRCGVMLIDEATKEFEIRTTTTTDNGNAFQTSGHFPASGLPQLDGLFEAWQHQSDFYSFDLAGEDLKEYLTVTSQKYRILAQEPGSSVAFPARQVSYFWPSPEGGMFVIAKEPLSAEAIRIMRRFTNTFSFAYTRFLELKQAEARAREAVRDASLDRVRAEIASMRTADDLQRITPVIWRELTTLGVPFFRCGVFIVDEAARIVHTYLSTPDSTSLAVMHLPFESIALTEEVVAHWKSRQVYTEQWDSEQFAAMVATLVEQGHLDGVEVYQGGEEPPERLALHFLPFTQGMLYVGSAAPFPDEQIDLVQTLADAFSVAYARYEDFTQLEAAKAKVEATLAKLKSTQAQLIQQEKMASLGQLTAGIAHEIKNPLNFVNNFAELNIEIVDELSEDLAQYPTVLASLEDLLADLKQNSGRISQHGKRADTIVHAMMQHASVGMGKKQPTDLSQLVSEHVDLAYHGKRAQMPNLEVEIERNLSDIGKVELVPQEIGRVLLNLLGNAFDTVHERALTMNGAYTPTVTVTTRQVNGEVEIRVSDNGTGIPEQIREKIFEPFYTTKPTGSGTGLGLSLSYDIVTQRHGGTLTVESEEGEGATFIVTLPVSKTEPDSSV